MKQNETFKAMLADYRPDLGNGDEYITNLQRRLDAIEAVKRMYAEERRRMHIRMVVAFVSGGIVGGVMTLYLLFHPVALVAPDRYLSDWLVANASSILTILTVPVFSVLAAVGCTLLYQIVKKDYSTEYILKV